MSGSGAVADSGLELTAQVVELVAAAAPEADAEVTVDRAELALTRFANSAIHQNVADESATVSLRIHLDGRTVSASIGLADRTDLRTFVERTLDAVRSGPADPGWPGVAPPAAVPPPVIPPPASTPAQRADAVRAFVDAVGGLETAGYCRERRNHTAFANSAGQTATAVVVTAAFDGIARNAGNDGVARLAATSVDALDGAVLGRRAAAKARAATDAVDLSPGRYEVLLEPAAVADLLLNLASYGFNGRAVTQRQSFAEVGTAQFDPSVSITDDPLAIGMTFDTEGTPTSRLVLVDHGMTAAVAYDRRTAAEAGATSTGHSVGAGTWGPIPVNLGLAPGPPARRADAPVLVDPAAAPLLGGVERGILVSDFWYTRVLDPKSLAVTGLTRNGVWLVEEGEVVRPLSNLRFTQAYAAALAPGAVRAVGPVEAGVPDSWDSMFWTAPALHLASWNFTGGASG